MRRTLPIIGLIAICLLPACSKPKSDSQPAQPTANSSDDKLLNFYTWADYMAPDTISAFEKQTGIKVNVSYFDSEETFEGRILTGHSGFDVVVPPANFIRREIRSGALQPLDKTKLANLVNLDPEWMSRVAVNDPQNAYGVVYLLGTTGIGFNKEKLAKVLPNERIDSWRVVFDPKYASRVAQCGMGILDSPAEIVRVILQYLGRNPDVATTQDLNDAEAVLRSVRPFIRLISSNLIEPLSNGEICLVVAYNGDVIQARNRARDAKNGVRISFLLPDEGSLMWADLLAIPLDAPHVRNAHIFINYLMEPQVIAKVSNAIGYANGNIASIPFLDPSIRSDPAAFPTQEQRKRLIALTENSSDQTRAITRMWQKFKTGQYEQTPRSAQIP